MGGLPAAALNANDSAGSVLGKYKARWPKRTDQELAIHVANVGALFRSTPPKLVQATSLRDSFTITPFDDPNLRVDYRSQFDDLRVEDLTRLPDTQPENDIGESAARQRTKEVFANLVGRGIVRKEHYDTNDMDTGHLRREEYAGDGKPPIHYVVEYRYRMLRKLNHINVANNGVVIGINPAGALSSIRLGGVEFESSGVGTNEVPGKAGGLLLRKVSTEAVAARFDREAGTPGLKKHVLWSKKMYVMPTNVEEAVLEPMLVYRFSTLAESNGTTFPSFVKVMGYSLTDVSAEAVDFATR